MGMRAVNRPFGSASAWRIYASYSSGLLSLKATSLGPRSAQTSAAMESGGGDELESVDWEVEGVFWAGGGVVERRVQWQFARVGAAWAGEERRRVAVVRKREVGVEKKNMLMG